MGKLTYPRSADAIATRARMTLAAYRAVPAREAAYHLGGSLQDMWNYGYFALHNADSAPWEWTRQHLFNAVQLLTTGADDPKSSARAAADAIHCFEQTAGIARGPAPETLYTRAEAEQAANAAFECISRYVKLDQPHDRQFVTEAFLAFLDNPDSPYPYKSHDLDDAGAGQADDGTVQAGSGPRPDETGERDTCRPDPARHAS
ncbi:hypothetical protein [Streptomyces sp. NPDC007088]|uniref:hypothetical protein n=1 Tax=Streptomyces sp. NPDC007088 TaxID=3364773 RepID=UPI0036811672